jgi:hypothetical protein
MASTQDRLLIQDIKDDLAHLNDGSFVVILQTSAVNFDLLSENEQLAIISSFAGLLNSLSFPIQILIRSKQLDISSYIDLLVNAEKDQTNPLLKAMMERYRIFVETIIRENEVLDKQFYVVLSVSSLELGIAKTPDLKLQKAKTVIYPRRDHVMRQLSRIGLRAEQLSSEKLIKLFYDIYNEIPMGKTAAELVLDTANQVKQAADQAQSLAPQTPPEATISQQAPQANTQPAQPLQSPTSIAAPSQLSPVTPLPDTTVAPTTVPASIPQNPAPLTTTAPSSQPTTPQRPANPLPQSGRNDSRFSNTPFVVEELSDDTGARA